MLHEHQGIGKDCTDKERETLNSHILKYNYQFCYKTKYRTLLTIMKNVLKFFSLTSVLCINIHVNIAELSSLSTVAPCM